MTRFQRINLHCNTRRYAVWTEVLCSMISELQPHANCRKSLKCPLRISLQSICNLNHSLYLSYRFVPFEPSNWWNVWVHLYWKGKLHLMFSQAYGNEHKAICMYWEHFHIVTFQNKKLPCHWQMAKGKQYI